MDKVVEYENRVFSEFQELFTDLLNTLKNTPIDNKLTIVERIKSVNDQIQDVNTGINALLIDIHKNNVNISEKELERRNDDENWKKVLTTFFPQMFLYNLLVNDDETEEESEESEESEENEENENG